MDYIMKFQAIFSRLTAIWYFDILLIATSLYSQQGYESHHVQLVCGMALLSTLILYLYYVSNYKGFGTYSIGRYKQYVKTPLSRTVSILCIVITIFRFIIPSKIVYDVQNILYVISFIYLFFVIFVVLFRRSGLNSKKI